MRPRGHSLSLFLLAACFLAVSAFASSQVLQPPGTMPDGRVVPFPGDHHAAKAAAGSVSAPASPAKPSPAPPLAVPSTPGQSSSLLNQPSRPATITLRNDSLLIRADNSSLQQILEQVARTSGMALDGLQSDQRVFGKYGPGKPQQVLAELLDGSGYNFVMVGDLDSGTPRQLLLTPINAGAPAASPQPSNPQPQSEEDDSSADTDNAPGSESGPLNPNRPRPGAENSPLPPNQVRTPEQMLQQLEQMRQQQQSNSPQ